MTASVGSDAPYLTKASRVATTSSKAGLYFVHDCSQRILRTILMTAADSVTVMVLTGVTSEPLNALAEKRRTLRA